MMSQQIQTRPPLTHRTSRWFSRNALRIYAVFGFIYLFIPIAYTMAFSFNIPGKSNLTWRGFTLENWQQPCRVGEVCSALRNSLVIGVTATIVATILGTMIAFALGRHRFRGRTATNLLIFLPMATPEVVLGASLLALFLNLGVERGITTVIIAHIMFCISFVVVTVKARVASLDPRLEQAAMDLYANERETFRRVTLPLVAPGILGGALLAFALSFDDYIITAFNSGPVTTIPKYVYTAALRGIPPQANVIGTAMFLIAMTIVLIGTFAGRKRRG